MAAPYFSIGVTTYNREALLREALQSIFSQTFGDFEIIIGNDYVPRPLSEGALGIKDSRMRIINHEKNIREVANMNFLLKCATGKYFTWLADDDFYHPEFLSRMKKSLESDSGIKCCFSGYSLSQKFEQPKDFPNAQPRLLSGSEFLEATLAGDIKTIIPYGVFDTEFLKGLGGIEPLVESASIGLYGEYLLTFKFISEQKVAFIDQPLVCYRAHEQSWGISNTDVEQYKTAGLILLKRGVRAMTISKGSTQRSRASLSVMMRVVLENLMWKFLLRDRRLSLREVFHYYFHLIKTVRESSDSTNIGQRMGWEYTFIRRGLWLISQSAALKARGWLWRLVRWRMAVTAGDPCENVPANRVDFAVGKILGKIRSTTKFWLMFQSRP